jgi:hypothetical protein
VAGTYVNMEGRLTTAQAAATPPPGARPLRTWLSSAARAFGARLRVDENWDALQGLEQDRLERPALPPVRAMAASPGGDEGEGLAVVTGPMAHLTHEPSEILARTPETHPVRLHPDDCARLGLDAAGDAAELVGADGRAAVGVRGDPRVPAGRVFVPAGLPGFPVSGGMRVRVVRREEVAVQ